MAKIQIKIPHIVWRAGRPRFVPGPALRKLGFQGEDLKDDAGNWLGLEATSAWAAERQAEITQSRDTATKGKAAPRKSPKLNYTSVGKLIALREQSPQWRDLAPKTQNWYRSMGGALYTYDQELWALPAKSINGPIAYGLYEKLRTDKGLTMARAIIATCRAAWSYGQRKGLVDHNPFRELGMKTPAPRLRVGSLHEMRTILATADAMGRPEIGDAIMLGLCTGQRQGDRLALVEEKRIAGRVRFRQSKTGARVSVPEIPALTVRLDAAQARRKSWRVSFANVIVDETARRIWAPEADYYRHVFADVRAAAVKGIKANDGSWSVEPCPSLDDFRDQDLRDTSVTWLANASCTIPEICAITGHSTESAHTILKHYLATTDEQADKAIGKLRAWLETQGGIA